MKQGWRCEHLVLQKLRRDGTGLKRKPAVGGVEKQAGGMSGGPRQNPGHKIVHHLELAGGCGLVRCEWTFWEGAGRAGK